MVHQNGHTEISKFLINYISFEERSRVIYQDSEIRGVGDHEFPSALILNLPKHCRHGVLKV
jgi:hypothetical protein